MDAIINFYDAFNNREKAIIAWIVCFSTYVFFSSHMEKARKSFTGLLGLIFSGPLIILVALILVYLALLGGLFNYLEMWNTTQFKNFIIWFFVIGLIPFYKNAQLSSFRNQTIKNILTDSLKLTLLLEFIVAAFPFSFAIEFLLIIPISSLLGVLLGFTQSESKHKFLHKIVFNLSAFLGSIIILHSAYLVYINISRFTTKQSLLDLLTPLLLTISYLPFLYILSTYMTYERCFSPLTLHVNSKIKYTLIKIYILFTFRTQIDLVDRWRHELLKREKINLSSAIAVAQKIVKLHELENNPPEVSIYEGWSPYLAKNFLSSIGLTTGYYSGTDGTWFACSNPIEFGKENIFRNNIAYYIEGTNLAAKELKTMININNTDEAENAHLKLAQAANILCLNSFEQELPEKVEESILSGKTLHTKIKYLNLDVIKKEWLNDGYSLEFIISCT